MRAFVLVTAGAIGLAAAIVGAATIPHRMAAVPSWEEPAPVAATSAATGHQPQGPPTRVRVPRIGVDAALVELGLDKAGKLEAPAVYDRAGWYSGGPAPGDVGPSVLAGHVDSKAGPAVFYRLHELKVGDRIEVRRGGGTVTFTVTGVTRHPKDEFPTDTVYGPTPGPELRLVTCGGVFDRVRNSYRDNIVVFAVTQPTQVIPKSAARR
ncbi:class F sortase [Phytohabitans suffuscus]|uniref:Class F sortase n=1 Tax=Phytohabitans suffuscus TaxID=624315 RepID=A0A6F8YD36_9ACTN|nr:class F sortase [Phytohabitans suffuscus]BCB83943.1 class F sortase [Phytohabitans suffuscus]